jgi:hypothetical protein
MGEGNKHFNVLIYLSDFRGKTIFYFGGWTLYE